MLADVAAVGLEVGGPLVGIAGLHRAQVGLEWGLRVDHHVLAARQLHHDVGPQAAGIGLEARLLDEVAAVDHPRHLADAPQLDLAPAAAGVR